MTGVSYPLAPLIVIPLLGAALAWFFGKSDQRSSGWIASAATFVCFLWSLRLVLALPAGHFFEQSLFPWIAVDDLQIEFLLRFDSLSAVLCLVVSGVGSLIHLYSVGYMAQDMSRPRFFAYMNLFMFFMLLLVLGGNLPVLFIGWEGVGLCSYLLIGFWFKNRDFAAAGRKAFIVNRIGDAGFLLAMFLLYRSFGTLDFMDLPEAIRAAAGLTPMFFTLVSLCLFAGACGKSAQIPLFVWLPDAMAGPTPVSALIHAATMVTAGVYLLARTSYIFLLSPLAMSVVLGVALLTAFVAATIALVQNDIKKVLAYSTVSQLGFMFLASAAGAFWVSIFHLVTHAFFKACLFLGAGSVIHGCGGEQDMRRMGGLWRKMPVTCVTYGLSVLAISGVFFFSGYQSKHAIIASLHEMQNPFALPYLGLVLVLVNVTAVCTAFYMTRSFALTFLGEYRGAARPHESPAVMTGPLIVLAVLSTLGGALLVTHGMSLEGFLAQTLTSSYRHTGEGVLSALLHSWSGILGVAAALALYVRFPQLPARVFRLSGRIGTVLAGRYYFDQAYDFLIIRPLHKLAVLLARILDQGVIDGLVNGAAGAVDLSGELRRVVQSGELRFYALCMFGASVCLIVFYLVR